MALKWVGLGWAVFTGSHLALSHPPIRGKLIDILGDDRFKGVYSLVAIGSFVPTTYLYIRLLKSSSRFFLRLMA